MVRRIAYGLMSVFGVLLAVGSALGAGMMTFKSEQKAQQHCPSDTVVWLNTTNATYHFKGDRWYGPRTAALTYVRTKPIKTG